MLGAAIIQEGTREGLPKKWSSEAGNALPNVMSSKRTATNSVSPVSKPETMVEGTIDGSVLVVYMSGPSNNRPSFV
ncbi:hypothetical protein Patl1_26706 [Pistacia atlantica]|uniref:Uncharacterized protein n=1 Tax=Pistacia atlantica TaxID=434234 RepID=A0ACC1B1H4_9ROSI|nr:hypothetical protein Patl1_26706 [Pistacia atlantica]